MVRLRNEERRPVRLVSALDRTSPQRAQVKPAVGVDPVHRTVIADENLVGVKLQIGTNKGARFNRGKSSASRRWRRVGFVWLAHLDLVVAIADDATAGERWGGLADLWKGYEQSGGMQVSGYSRILP